MEVTEGGYAGGRDEHAEVSPADRHATGCFRTRAGHTHVGRTVYGRAVSDLEAVVEGYCNRSSYEPGEQLVLHCGATLPRPSGRVASATEPLAFSVEVARLGQHREIVHRIDGLVAENHPIPDEAAGHGADWPSTTSFATDSAWRSGWYEIRLTTTRPDGSTIERTAGFVLRAATGKPSARILFPLALNTWNAYNDWGRSNLYTGGTHVSFRRPFAKGFLDRPDAGAHRLANSTDEPDLNGDIWTAYYRTNAISSWSGCAGWPTWEGPFAVWAERNGYELDYAVNADLEERPEILDAYPMMLSVGHDEYWSSPMRDTVEAFIRRGGNVAFLSGNTSFWQVRLEDGGTTMVSYKDTARRQDPLRHSHPELLTGMWSDPIIGRPESRMTGVSFSRGGYARQAGCTPRGQRGYTVWQPEHWLFEGTDLRYGDLLGATHCVVGYECDGCEMTTVNGLPAPTHTDGTPESFAILGSAPARLYHVDIEAGINEYPTGLQAMRTVGELVGVAHVLFGSASPESIQRVAHGNAVLGSYVAPSGGTVVTSGCTDWAYGLAGDDPLVEQVTRNVLDRLSGAPNP